MCIRDSNISASNIAVIGVNSVCLQTVQLFVAIDGAILWATIFKGWLNGVIADIAVNGSLIVKIFLDFPWGVKSHEKISPSSWIHNCAVKENTSKALPTSYKESC